MIQSVFVDMDMVLADFITGLEYKYNVSLPDGFGYEAGRALDRSWEVLKWELNQDFWSGLKPMPWAQTLMKWLTHEFDQVYILSTVEPINGYIDGKLLWLGIWFPEYVDKLITVGHDCKHLLARPSALLIDDYPKNIKAWRARRGKAIQVPARWKDSSRTVRDYNIFDAVVQETGIALPTFAGDFGANSGRTDTQRS